MRTDSPVAPLIAGSVFIAAFALLAAALLTIDVAPIAADGTNVGLASFNAYVHAATGESALFYKLSDVLVLFPLASMLIFGVLGLRQVIGRRSAALVDDDLLALGALYVVMLLLYLLFNHVSLNNRPVFEDGICEPSFPSSHTLLAVTALGAAAVQAKMRLEGAKRAGAVCLCVAVMVVLVAARLLSGVHWATDIAGGVLLGAALVCLYAGAATMLRGSAVRGKHARR